MGIQLSQYKADIFKKIKVDFKKGKTLLDVGCGDGTDAEIFIENFGLKVTGTDVYLDKNIANIKKLKFKKGSILSLPFPSQSFDYIFLHDVLHHVDEKTQNIEKHIKALKELRRVCQKKGVICIVEGNRYNPLFYPHMVRLKKHEHFSQDYFYRLVKSVFPNARISHFEAHLYPQSFLLVFKVYEWIMEHIIPRHFSAYNMAVIVNE